MECIIIQVMNNECNDGSGDDQSSNHLISGTRTNRTIIFLPSNSHNLTKHITLAWISKLIASEWGPSWPLNINFLWKNFIAIAESCWKVKRLKSCFSFSTLEKHLSTCLLLHTANMWHQQPTRTNWHKHAAPSWNICFKGSLGIHSEFSSPTAYGKRIWKMNNAS